MDSKIRPIPELVSSSSYTRLFRFTGTGTVDHSFTHKYSIMASTPIQPARKEPPSAPAGDSTLQRAKTNLTYLALGSGAAVAPSSLKTRSFLTTTRYVMLYHIMSCHAPSLFLIVSRQRQRKGTYRELTTKIYTSICHQTYGEICKIRSCRSSSCCPGRYTPRDVRQWSSILCCARDIRWNGYRISYGSR